MKIDKSSRHSKIAGNFGEMLVLYWLSKSKFECAVLDHTGIDLIAARDGKRLGISVKTRSRYEGTESTSVNLDESHFVKITEACRAFACEEYLAIVVEARDAISVFIMPCKCAKELCTKAKVGENLYWQMTPK